MYVSASRFLHKSKQVCTNKIDGMANKKNDPTEIEAQNAKEIWKQGQSYPYLLSFSTQSTHINIIEN